MSARQDDLQAEDQSAVDKINRKKLQDAKEAEEKRKAAAAAALAAQRAAAEKQFASMEDTMNRRKAIEQVDIVDELNYWEAMLVPAQKYAENVPKVYAKVGALNQEFYRQLDQMAAKAVEDQKRDQEQMAEQLRQLIEVDDKWARALHHAADAAAALAAVNLTNVNAMREMTIAHDESTGAITRNAAALQLAQLHASTYAAQLAAIAKEKENDDLDSSLSPDKRRTNQDERDVRAATIAGEASRTAQEDRWNEFTQTALGGAVTALEKFGAEATDVSDLMSRTITQTLNGFNDLAVKELTGQGGREKNLRVFALAETRDLAGEGLKSGEGMLFKHLTDHLDPNSNRGKALQALGIGKGAGKPTGSSSSPFYVHVMNAVGDPSARNPASQATSIPGAQDLSKTLYPNGMNDAAATVTAARSSACD